MIYKMFSNTLAKMNDNDLQNTLIKAKELLSDKDYQSLLSMIEKQRSGNGDAAV